MNVQYAACLNTGENSASDCRAFVQEVARSAIEEGYQKELSRRLPFCIYSKMHDSCRMLTTVPEDRLLNA